MMRFDCSTRCLEEVKKLTVRFEAKLRDHDTEKVSHLANTECLSFQPLRACFARYLTVLHDIT